MFRSPLSLIWWFFCLTRLLFHHLLKLLIKNVSSCNRNISYIFHFIWIHHFSRWSFHPFHTFPPKKTRLTSAKQPGDAPAKGTMGLRGQLSAGEILEQIFHAKRLARASVFPGKNFGRVDGSCGAPPWCEFQHRCPKDGHIYWPGHFLKNAKKNGIQPLCFLGYTTQ